MQVAVPRAAQRARVPPPKFKIIYTRDRLWSLSDEALFRSHVNSFEHPSTQTLSTSFPYQSSLILYYFQ